ncbi:MAG: 1-deoxy-D-xylulose-5-phosphate synthase [Ruminococcaceae bacterium]|nr:1-deoxy-D-xylulose-5-phosphate synthase [Oscillospiraceae bacterium]
MKPMLENICSPLDLQNLSKEELIRLSAEIRKKILETVSENGGHLASNLGMTEATIALHKNFRSPEDKIIFDVSHQCYAHKLLTGRYESFSTLRKKDGISGFTNREESEHDIFTEGHSGSSVSAALGIAQANRLKGNDAYTIAVVGDGSLTNGMIYEALNNCAEKPLNLIIILNDNDMSISRNIGGLHDYLSKIRTSKRYYRLKKQTEKILKAVPLVGTPLLVGSKKLKDATKRFFVKNNIFEDLGLIYLGPVDGHNFEKMDIVLQEAKSKHTCCIVHMVTKKGIGYAFSEKEPDKYHGIGPFDLQKGANSTPTENYSSKAGEILCTKASADKRVCAITAAMCEGTGLSAFAKAYPERFFDVGIAEEHAVTFAGGLSANGLKPAVFLYSTFAQRVYDQISHDIAIQKLPLLLAIDRAGLVAGDGITHQGIFDYAIFSSIPGTEMDMPETYAELETAFSEGLQNDKISVVRYPKGKYEPYSTPSPMRCVQNLFTYSENIETAETVVITAGRLTKNAAEAIALTGKNIALVKLIRVFPIPTEELFPLLRNFKNIYLLEEGFEEGGFAQKIAALIRDKNVRIHAVSDFIPHGELSDLYALCGFTKEQLAKSFCEWE